MKVPSFMLKKLYVKGSLEASGDSFQFKLKNNLATATVVDAPEIYIDGDSVDAEDISFQVGGGEVAGTGITEDDPFRLEKGVEVTVASNGLEVGPGAHKLRIKVATKEWDTLDFEVEDSA
ncbi:MAG: hydroxymethylglutaryl-CoA reductase [Candidatus Thermoplasmatota archaeon]|nr:hydroxymethylglutaryl-CoA reductase [Candidatus Thermoplasmatota archaeon]